MLPVVAHDRGIKSAARNSAQCSDALTRAIGDVTARAHGFAKTTFGAAINFWVDEGQGLQIF